MAKVTESMYEYTWDGKKRQRLRVPVACLNCKRRKVRCDKAKPCSGCVKNNVGHLCVYLEPKWADKSAQAAGTLEDYLRLKAEMELVVALQKAEIEKLKEQLAAPQMAPGPAPPIAPVAPAVSVVDSLPADLDLGTGTVTVLRKLNMNGARSPVFRVMDDEYYSVKGYEDTPVAAPAVGSLYSWLNIIKIDPQLTALWFRITGLQKSYHIYKTSLLNKPRQDSTSSAQSMDGPPESNGGCGHHQCPVVACEFNLIVEESAPEGTPLEESASKTDLLEDADRLHIKIQNDDAVDLLTLLQKLWLEIRNSGRGSEKLNYEQIRFLVNFYMNNTACCPYKLTVLQEEVESSHLLRFFENQILLLLQKNDEDDVRLDLAVFSPEMSDEEVMGFLKLKGIYLSMLGLIVEEALDCLRVGTYLTDLVIKEFHQHFPLEAVHLGMGYKCTQSLPLIRDFICGLPKKGIRNQEIEKLLALRVLITSMLNRVIALYEKSEAPLDVKTSFNALLTLALDGFSKDDEHTAVWSDPYQVVLEGSMVTDQQQNDLRLLFCQLWGDIMRIINHTIFNVVPLVKHSEHIDNLLLKFLSIMADVGSSDLHISYLQSMAAKSSDSHITELMTSLQVYFLIAKATVLIREGIYGNRKRVSLAATQAVISEIASWGDNISLTKLRMARYFEARSILNYLELYFTAILFLQCEETGSEEAVSKLIPILFTKSLDLNKFLQGSIVQFSKAMSSNYVLAAIAENLARVSHLIAGLLIRFQADPSARTPSPIPNGAKPEPLMLNYALQLKNFSISIKMATKETVIAEVDRTISMLENAMSRESSQRRTKIWKFYMTFVRNSHRMNSESYAKLHASAFGNGRLLDACPVMRKDSPKYPTSAIRMEQRCPVIHSGSPMQMSAKSSFSGTATESPGSGRCPVSHTMSRGGSISRTPLSESPAIVNSSGCPYSGSAPSTATPTANMKPSGCPYSNGAAVKVESGRKRQCPVTHGMASVPEVTVKVEEERERKLSRTMPMAMDAPPAMDRGFPPQMQLAPPSGQAQFQAMEMMDWDSLPNFTFDLMGDEGLMGQIGGDLGNAPLEGFFQ